jgi:hypothetical protein
MADSLDSSTAPLRGSARNDNYDAVLTASAFNSRYVNSS